jgi:hypothetical protein
MHLAMARPIEGPPTTEIPNAAARPDQDFFRHALMFIREMRRKKKKCPGGVSATL